MSFHVSIYVKSQDLPDLLEDNFFHSRELFLAAERSAGTSPHMAVAFDDNEQVVAQMLAISYRHALWFPPYLYTHAHVYGEGEYAQDIDKQATFQLLLQAMTEELDKHLCLYIEYSNMEKKMFGYRHFRRQGYFPVAWQVVRNSLHSMAPQDRLSEKMRQRIKKSMQRGVDTHEAQSPEELKAFHQLLKGYYRFKIRRHVPGLHFFEQLSHSGHCQILVATHHGKVIGGCVCIYSKGNAYLWYLASRRKTYAFLHPNLVTVWQAISEAYAHGCAHINFMDVGLPWRKNPLRDFILSFGGKPVAQYRWFRFASLPINKLMSWRYREL